MGRRSGFTIIEVMLFLAISGFLLVGILLGTGSSIANQRYKDAVQDAVDALKSAYSFVSDTQIELRDANNGVCGSLTSEQLGEIADMTEKSSSGRGRTNCVVYGAAVSIRGDTLQTTTVIGEDYIDAVREGLIEEDSAMSDLEILAALHANNVAAMCDAAGGNCTIRTAGNARTQKLKWDVILRNPVNDAGEKTDFKKTILIIRSPRSGTIRTYVMDGVVTYAGSEDYNTVIGTGVNIGNKALFDSIGINKLLIPSKFKEVEAKICVDSNGSASYADHSRMIRILKNSHSQSGIELVDMDSDEAEDSCD